MYSLKRILVCDKIWIILNGNGLENRFSNPESYSRFFSEGILGGKGQLIDTFFYSFLYLAVVNIGYTELSGE